MRYEIHYYFMKAYGTYNKHLFEKTLRYKPKKVLCEKIIK
jgi:hypothetical protein